MKKMLTTLVVLIGIAPVQAVQYSVTALGDASWYRSEPIAINDSGQIIGSVTIYGSPASYFLYDNGQVTDLGSFRAAGINNHGQVVGSMLNEVGHGAVAVYTVGCGFENIGTLNGLSTYAQGISDAGRIVGYASEARNLTHAFSYQQGAFVELGMPGGQSSSAVAVNSEGRVLGTFRMQGGTDRICIYEPDGSINDLGFEHFNDRAYDMNHGGWVVGRATLESATTTAFVRSPDGLVLDLGVLAGDYYYSTAFSINNVGQVVGEAAIGFRTFHAFIYENGQMTDLNDLIALDSGWVLQRAMQINNTGQIIGMGTYEGQPRSFLLSPIPEPASLLLLALGGMWLGRRAGLQPVR